MARESGASTEHSPHRRVLVQIFSFASAGIMGPWLLDQVLLWI